MKNIITVILTVAFSSMAPVKASTQENCHILTGVWIQDSIVNDLRTNPCGATTQSDSGLVIKLDRYHITCEGKVDVRFGFSNENHYLQVSRLFINPDGKMQDSVYSAQYEKVSDLDYNIILENSHNCLK